MADDSNVYLKQCDTLYYNDKSNTSDNVNTCTNNTLDTLTQNSELQQNNENNENIENNINQQKLYYRNIALEFINSNKKHLASIYLQHATTNSDEDKKGILGINLKNFLETQKIDVAFIPFRVLPEDIITKFNNIHILNSSHIIYFILITNLEEQIIEIDIRTLTT